MNQTDRERLARLRGCMTALPWPNRSRTLGPADLSEFFGNMERLVPQFTAAITAIARCDAEWEDPDGELDELEALLRGMGGQFPPVHR